MAKLRCNVDSDLVMDHMLDVIRGVIITGKTGDSVIISASENFPHHELDKPYLIQIIFPHKKERKKRKKD